MTFYLPAATDEQSSSSKFVKFNYTAMMPFWLNTALLWNLIHNSKAVVWV